VVGEQIARRLSWLKALGCDYIHVVLPAYDSIALRPHAHHSFMVAN
jgi:hypothetical protein